ncbi:hypothetical protein PYJP_03380 [Pyrofollis japonicus]|uniref:DNA double-strand break repair nuclease NurA n=1 Tax=Pyrofollis japonicus TaxID=3060460 RepID=UPI00295AC301|nr:DNA double-strand break repair nuclease NurA [Pyrofollis japonicus]BEP16986.1 hypothetical protein PYJP_03380 [Pyrofollis japonicus]
MSSHIDIIDVDDLDKAITRIARKLQAEVRSIGEKIRSRLPVRRICGGFQPKTVHAVDSAFPSQPLQLVGLSLSIVAATLLRIDGQGVSHILRRRIITSYFSELEQDYVTMLARTEERKLILSLEALGDIVLIDGEIIPYRAPSNEWNSVLNLSRELLNRSMSERAPVVGVIKRSYSNELGQSLGISMNDKALATIILRRGEYVVLEPRFKLLKEYGCKLVFYKPSRGLNEAVKIELCGVQDDDEICKIIGFLSVNAGHTGLPWQIDMVDSLSKSAINIIDAIRNRLIAKLAVVDAAALSVGYPTNPQERRIKEGA